MNYRWLPAFGVTAVAMALAGCGSGNSSGSTSIRLANATLTHPSLDLTVNGGVGVTADTTDTVSNYASGGSGPVALQINDTGGTTSLSGTVPTLASGAHYLLVAYESGGAVKTALIGEDVALPAAGVTLRIYDAAVEAGKLDVYFTTATGATACAPGNLTTPVSSFSVLTAPAATAVYPGVGTYTVCVTGGGSKTDLRMTLPITLTSQTVATLLLTPASGGSLLNGSLAIQQGAYTAARNTNTRVRLAAAVTPGAQVAASSSSGVTINAGTASPSLDFAYALVPASDSLNVTVNSASVGAPAGQLPVGGDVTLLVYGNAASAKASLLTDDNRVPTDPTATKLRLINGITGSPGNVTLTANNTPVGINVAPGTESPSSALIPGSTNAIQFALTSSSGPLTLASGSSQFLSPASTYTVLAGGDTTVPSSLTLLIR
ncbi:MAG: DUF4397 domain-containing protein [Pseudomonadota bacterium]|nr:DUF4397 domain-containing protein [Pseudomonadota bacterium]